MNTRQGIVTAEMLQPAQAAQPAQCDEAANPVVNAYTFGDDDYVKLSVFQDVLRQRNRYGQEVFSLRHMISSLQAENSSKVKIIENLKGAIVLLAIGWSELAHNVPLGELSVTWLSPIYDKLVKKLKVASIEAGRGFRETSRLIMDVCKEVAED